MLQFIVKVDGKHGTQRITIPYTIREEKQWNQVALYRIILQDDKSVTLEAYKNYDDLRE